MQFAPAYADRQPLTAEEEAYNFLLNAICGGRYRKGDRLIAEDIASEIGMSRMPVREAFRRLDAQGLVTLRPNRGAIVGGLDIDELHEVFEMRSALEGGGACCGRSYRRAPTGGPGALAGRNGRLPRRKRRVGQPAPRVP